MTMPEPPVSGILAPLSAPVVKLIESVGDAVGVIYEPTRIRRRAKAEADALITNARAEVEVAEIADRAMKRLAYQEVKRQINIENIIADSIPLIANDSQKGSETFEIQK
ncbi:MAG: hypothetical protein ABI457_13565 [Hyphomicrobium sp.]